MLIYQKSHLENVLSSQFIQIGLNPQPLVLNDDNNNNNNDDDSYHNDNDSNNDNKNGLITLNEEKAYQNQEVVFSIIRRSST